MSLGRWIAIITLAGFVGLLTYGVFAQGPDKSIDYALSRGKPIAAPAFELEVLDAGEMPARLQDVVDRAARDGRVALDELKGVPIVLNLWASWCPPCRDEAPVLERAWRESGPAGVLFVGLDSRDVRDDARAFLREFKLSYLNIREGDRRISDRYGATGLPETFSIDGDGQIVGHVIGAVSLDQLQAGVIAARSERPAPAIQGGERRSSQ